MIGSSKEGNSAIIVTNNFKMGYSDINETFDNPILTKDRDFIIKRFEAWGFVEWHLGVQII